jgi:hypothetical protein
MLWDTKHKSANPEPEFVSVSEVGNQFQGIGSASLCSLAGRYDQKGCHTVRQATLAGGVDSLGSIPWDRSLNV